MKKTEKYFWVDTGLLGFLTTAGLTGLILWSLPRRAGWGATRWFFKDIHKWAGLGMTGLGGYHLYLHWDWYKKMARKYLNTDSVSSVKKYSESEVD